MVLAGVASACGGSSAHTGLGLLLQVLRETGGRLLWSVGLWTTGAGLLGVAVAIGAFVGIRKIGGYPWQWRGGGCLQSLVFVLMLVVFAISFGISGFLEGVLRGSEQALRQGKLVDEYYPRIGQVGADLLGMLSLLSEQAVSQDDPEPSPLGERLLLESEELLVQAEAFRDDRWQLDVGRLFEQMERLGDEAAALVPMAREKALERFPEWRQSTGERLLSWFLDNLAGTMVSFATESTVDGLGIRPVTTSFFHGLEQLAAAHGDPATVSHRELSTYLVEAVLVRSSLHGLRLVIRGNQLGLLLPVLLTLLGPVLLLNGVSLINRRWSHRRSLRNTAGQRDRAAGESGTTNGEQLG